LTVEALIENRLSLYYVLLLLALGVSIVSNSKKDKRIEQAVVAKFYSVMAIIFFVLFMLNYAVADTLQNLQATSSSNLGYMLFIFLLNKVGELLVIFSFVYPIIALGVVLIGSVKKFRIKFKSTRKKANILSDLYGSKNARKVESKINSNFIVKNCYDEQQNLNETGKVIVKISQNMAYTLFLLYILNPLLRHFNINLVFSSITFLFLGITFLEIYFSLNN